jgi:hypothetical protein
LKEALCEERKVLDNVENGGEKLKKQMDHRKEAEWWNSEWFFAIGEFLE